MSLMKRISTIFRAKANKALDRAEDPRETLDYSYQRQVEMLAKVRRGVADVATSRKRVELQVNQLRSQSAKLTEQAQKALGMGREDLAREALTRKSALTSQINGLQEQHAQLQGEEEKLTLASQRLQAKVEAFRTRKETIKATYTAAEAQTRINEAFSGISEEMGDVGMAVQRAEDKTQQMQARAGAIDELIASGALDDATAVGPGDDISRELESMSSESDVEAELAALKSGVSTPAIDGPGPEAAGSPTSTEQSAGETPEESRSEQGAGMIVRILGEGQFEVADAELDRLNELDAAVEAEVDAGNQEAFRARLAELLDGVREVGAPLADDSLEDSDLILPPADATLEEVQRDARRRRADPGLSPAGSRSRIHRRPATWSDRGD